MSRYSKLLIVLLMSFHVLNIFAIQKNSSYIDHDSNFTYSILENKGEIDEFEYKNLQCFQSRRDSYFYFKFEEISKITAEIRYRNLRSYENNPESFITLSVIKNAFHVDILGRSVGDHFEVANLFSNKNAAIHFCHKLKEICKLEHDTSFEKYNLGIPLSLGQNKEKILLKYIPSMTSKMKTIWFKLENPQNKEMICQ